MSQNKSPNRGQQDHKLPLSEQIQDMVSLNEELQRSREECARLTRLLDSLPFGIASKKFGSDNYDFINNQFIKITGINNLKDNIEQEKNSTNENLLRFLDLKQGDLHKRSLNNSKGDSTCPNELKFEAVINNNKGEDEILNVKMLEFAHDKNNGDEIITIIEFGPCVLPGDIDKQHSLYFKDVIDYSNFIAYRFNAKENRIDYISKKAEGFLGYSLEQQLSKDLLEISTEIHPEDWNLLVQRVEELRRKTNSNIVQIHAGYRRLDSNGIYRPMRDYMTFIFDSLGTVEFIMGAVEDISEKVKAEDAKIKQESKFIDLFKITGEYVWEYYLASNEIIINNSLSKILGYSLDNKAETLESWIELIHEQDRKQFRDELENLINRSVAHSKTAFRFDSLSGDTYWFYFRAKVTELDEIGNASKIIAVLTDITQIKKLEILYRKSEKNLRKLFENSLEGTFIVDEQGIIIEWNAAQEKLTGISWDKAVGKALWDIQYQLLPEIRKSESAYEQLKVSLQEFLRTGESEWNNKKFVHEILSINGTLKSIESYIIPFTTENGFRIASVSRDITGAMLREVEQNETERCLKEIFYNSQDILYRVDLKTFTFNNVSPAVFSILGYNPEDIENLTTTDIVQLLHPIDQELFTELPQQIAAFTIDDPRVFHREYRMKHRDGSFKWLSDKQTLVFDDSGIPAYIVGSIREITEDKLAMEILEQSEDRYKMLSREFRGILDAIPDSLIVLTPELEFKWANKTALDAHKTTQSKIVGKKCYNVWHNLDEPCQDCPVLETVNTLKPVSKILSNDNRIWDVRTIPILASNGKIISIIELAKDITIRKNTEEKLRLSEEKYRLLVENIQSGIYIIQDEKFIYANKKFCDMTGYDYNELIGLDIIELTAPEDREIIIGAYRKRLEGEKTPISYNYSILHKDKKTKVLVNRRGDLITIGGRFATMGVVTPITDINLLENIQKSLYKVSNAANFAKNLDEFYLFIYKAINELLSAKNFYIALCDWDNKTVSFPFYVDEYDSPEPSSIPPSPFGTGMTEYFLHTGEPEIISLDRFNELIEAGKVELIGTDSEFYLGAPLKTADNRIIGMIAVQTYDKNEYYTETDKNILTFVAAQLAIAMERMKTQAALSDSESKYRLLVEHAFDAIYLMRETHYEYVNNMFCQLTGYSYNELTSPDFDYETLLPEETREFMKERYKLRIEGKPITPKYEVKIQNRNGQLIDVEVCTVSIAQPGEVAVLGFMRDITDRKIAERAIRDLNKQLEDRVAERTAQLENVLRDLKLEIAVRRSAEEKLIQSKNEITKAFEREKQLNDLKTRFISMISHEYRTPLTIIMTSTYLIEKFFTMQDEEKFNNKIFMIRSAINTMTELLENVLTVGRLDSGEMVLDFTTINLIEFCRHLIRELSEADPNQHQIKLVSKSVSVILKTDMKLLRMIISNLLTNAIKFSAPKTTVTIEIIDDYSDLTIKVSDEGYGMLQDDIEHLYEPFYRGKNIGVVPGTGLGLAIVKRCIERLNGRIKVNTNIDSGTEFIINIKKLT